MPVDIVLYRWAGSWVPFRIRTPCGECTLTRDIIRDTLVHELCDADTRLLERDWLSCWWQPLWRGGWHAPIVMIDGRVIAQGAALNRGVLCQRVIEAQAVPGRAASSLSPAHRQHATGQKRPAQVARPQ